MSDELVAPKGRTVNDDRQEITKKPLRGSPSSGGAISEIIGTGPHAINSIVWITIRWTLIIGALVTLALFLRPVYCGSDYPGSLIEDVKTTWSIFLPIVTLALGYIFGKSK